MSHSSVIPFVQRALRSMIGELGFETVRRELEISERILARAACGAPLRESSCALLRERLRTWLARSKQPTAVADAPPTYAGRNLDEQPPRAGLVE